MSYAQKKEISGNRTLAIIMVVVIQFALGYAIVTGLAYNIIKKASENLKTFEVEEQPPPPEKPPPPPKDMPKVPPPPMMPPPIVRMMAPPPPIQMVTAPAAGIHPAGCAGTAAAAAAAAQGGIGPAPKVTCARCSARTIIRPRPSPPARKAPPRRSSRSGPTAALSVARSSARPATAR